MSIMFNWASFFTYATVTAVTPRSQQHHVHVQREPEGISGRAAL